MKKNVITVKVVENVILGLMGVAAITCIIISMVTDKTAPYLAIGLGLAGVANIIRLFDVRKQKGKNNGSGKDGSIS